MFIVFFHSGKLNPDNEWKVRWNLKNFIPLYISSTEMALDNSSVIFVC